MADGPKTLEDWLKGGSILVSDLKEGNVVIVEGVFGAIFEIKIVDAANVFFYASQGLVPKFAEGVAVFAGSLPGVKGINTLIPNRIVKGCRMKVEWPEHETGFISEAVETATLYGNGWHYTVIE
jgi:hypothetical protein